MGDVRPLFLSSCVWYMISYLGVKCVRSASDPIGFRRAIGIDLASHVTCIWSASQTSSAWCRHRRDVLRRACRCCPSRIISHCASCAIRSVHKYKSYIGCKRASGIPPAAEVAGAVASAAATCRRTDAVDGNCRPANNNRFTTAGQALVSLEWTTDHRADNGVRILSAVRDTPTNQHCLIRGVHMWRRVEDGRRGHLQQHCETALYGGVCRMASNGQRAALLDWWNSPDFRYSISLRAHHTSDMGLREAVWLTNGPLHSPCIARGPARWTVGLSTTPRVVYY